MTNTKTNKILFIPDAYYLSDPLFLRFSTKKLKGFDYIYLDCNFPLSFIQDHGSTEYIPNFDEYLEVQNPYKDFFYNIIYKKGYIYRLYHLKKFIISYKKYRECVYSALNNIMPAVIVVTTDMLMINRDILTWASLNKVPSIVYQSALIKYPVAVFINKLKNSFYKLILNKLLNIPLANLNHSFGNENNKGYLFLWGHFFKKEYTGIKDDYYIKLVGNPEYDEIIEKSTIRISNQRKIFPSEKVKILICTTPLAGFISQKKINEINNIYKNLVLEKPEWYFCFKIHPREDINEYLTLFNKNSLNNFCIEKDKELATLFDEYQIQISLGSLTSFTAIMSGLPIILLKSETLPVLDIFTNEIEERADSLYELKEKIIKINSKKYYEHFLEKRTSFLKKMLIPNSIAEFNKSIGEVINNGVGK